MQYAEKENKKEVKHASFNRQIAEKQGIEKRKPPTTTLTRTKRGKRKEGNRKIR